MTTFHYRTRVAVIIDSHANGNFEVSRDCIMLSTNKTTKSAGKWQISLVPRRNYIDLIHPNDVVNIYIDPGDGESGFVRTMFGYVDRVERSEKTDQDGKIQTEYAVLGTDFQKAIDKTSLFFNNYMRQILDERLARSDDGAIRGSQRNDAEGSALRNAGVTAVGTPADLVENFLMTLLGFAQQWKLPDSYSRARKQIELNRKRRLQRAKSRVPEVVRDKLSTLGLNPAALDSQIESFLQTIRDTAVEPTDAEREAGFDEEQHQAAVDLRSESSLITLRAVAQSIKSKDVGILDVMSFDFIEALCVDGWQANATVWQAGSQTLAQFLYGNSNGIINELIFDLRPETVNGALAEGEYSRAADEISGNVADTEEFTRSVYSAVKYVPAVVFREYPYTTAEGLDLSSLLVLPEGESESEKVSPGFVHFGPIFSIPLGNEKAGRVTFTYADPIRPNKLDFFDEAEATKHLDVVVITNEDVQNSHIGRSDDDVINVIQMGKRESGAMDTQDRSVLSNFSPVINQISMARNGIRVWEGQTQYANWSVAGTVGGAADNSQIRRNLVRWQLLLDHWWQHNHEYLSGTIVLRGMPNIRVGYRLDWADRKESYYVESVQHAWQYPGVFTTTVQVSRGQRNDPYPVYIPPVFINNSAQSVSGPSGNRSKDGRLGEYFRVLSTNATLNSTEGEGPFEATEINNIDKYAEQKYPDKIVQASTRRSTLERELAESLSLLSKL